MEQHSLKSGCFLFGKDDIFMAIKNITTNDLRKMNDKEGIILQGVVVIHRDGLMA